jgi:hypothetical protein
MGFLTRLAIAALLIASVVYLPRLVAMWKGFPWSGGFPSKEVWIVNEVSAALVFLVTT